MEEQREHYRFLIFRGNNSALIASALRRREWWHDAVTIEADKRTDGKIGTSRKGEPASEESAKAGPVTQRVSVLKRVRATTEEFEKQAFHFLWKPFSAVTMSSRDGVEVTKTVHSGDPAEGFGYRSPSGQGAPQRQIVNHFPNLNVLSSKNGLLRSLEAFYSSKGIAMHMMTPTSFICRNPSLKQTAHDQGWSNFVARFKAISERNFAGELCPAKHCLNNIWIVKPSNNNQGKGIRVFDQLSKIKRFMGSQRDSEEWIIQKYLERPLLLWGRKFDIRIWVLVTEDWNIYIYREGYLRTSSSEYSTNLRGDSSSESFVHLTNFCMQKHSPSVGKYEDGNTLSYDDFQQYVDEHFADKELQFRADILPKIKSLIVDAILAARMAGLADGNDSNNRKRHQFELFGYDFMIDEDFRPWLIEVNTNPYLGTQNSWHGVLVQSMVEDMVSLVVDPLFPPPGQSEIPPRVKRGGVEQSRWSVGFEHVYSSDSGLQLDSSGMKSYEERASDIAKWCYSPFHPSISEMTPSLTEIKEDVGRGHAMHGTADRKELHQRRQHLSSRERARKSAAARVAKRKRNLAKQMHESFRREKAEREQRAASRRKLREDSRKLFRSALTAEPVQHERPPRESGSIKEVRLSADVDVHDKTQMARSASASASFSSLTQRREPVFSTTRMAGPDSFSNPGSMDSPSSTRKVVARAWASSTKSSARTPSAKDDRRASEKRDRLGTKFPQLPSSATKMRATRALSARSQASRALEDAKGAFIWHEGKENATESARDYASAPHAHLEATLKALRKTLLSPRIIIDLSALDMFPFLFRVIHTRNVSHKAVLCASEILLEVAELHRVNPRTLRGMGAPAIGDIVEFTCNCAASSLIAEADCRWPLIQFTMRLLGERLSSLQSNAKALLESFVPQTVLLHSSLPHFEAAATITSEKGNIRGSTSKNHVAGTQKTSLRMRQRGPAQLAHLASQYVRAIKDECLELIVNNPEGHANPHFRVSSSVNVGDIVAQAAASALQQRRSNRQKRREMQSQKALEDERQEQNNIERKSQFDEWASTRKRRMARERREKAKLQQKKDLEEQRRKEAERIRSEEEKAEKKARLRRQWEARMEEGRMRRAREQAARVQEQKKLLELSVLREAENERKIQEWVRAKDAMARKQRQAQVELLRAQNATHEAWTKRSLLLRQGGQAFSSVY
eukprot:g814.t1